MQYPLEFIFTDLIYRPFIFDNMELPGNTTSLLATGVVGIFEFIFTIPAVLWVDQIGRKKILITGAIGMAVCHFIVAGIIGAYQGEFGENRAAGWTAIVFIWIFVINFAYSWGLCRPRNPVL
jgi:MFS family permease